MAKTMARLSGDVVVNLEWCSDDYAETETLKNIGETNVSIGDLYKNGTFYHAVNMLTDYEKTYKNR